MSFRCYLGLTGLLFAAAAGAQTDAAAAQVIPAEENAPATVTALTDADAPAVPGTVEAGAAKAAACAACHGADGNSADPQYPKLAGQHERYIARQLALFKTGERNNPIMMGFAAPLSTQDMRDLGAYFASQTVVPGMADDTVVASGRYEGMKYWQIGERLYRGGDAARQIPACMACHGPSGDGNPGVPYPRLGGQHAAYTGKQLAAFHAGTVYGTGDNANSIMANVAANLTEEEMQALASYIEGLHHAESPGTAGGR